MHNGSGTNPDASYSRCCSCILLGISSTVGRLDVPSTSLGYGNTFSLAMTPMISSIFPHKRVSDGVWWEYFANDLWLMNDRHNWQQINRYLHQIQDPVKYAEGLQGYSRLASFHVVVQSLIPGFVPASKIPFPFLAE